MKKFAVVGLIFVLMLASTGCSDDITLTEEDNDLVAEYIAGVLLKHSYENEWDYRKLKNAGNSIQGNGVTQPESNSSTAGGSLKPTGGSSGGGQSKVDTIAAMKDSLGFTGVEIVYQKYLVGDRYPTGEYVICVPASEGCKVVAFEFQLTNKTGDEVTADTLSSGLTMKLTVGGKNIPQSVSMLKNDLMGLSGVKIAAGETYTAAVIFQVPESTASDLTGMSLTAYVNGTSIGLVPGL